MVKTDQRNYGIDLLRIMSMMMVCTLHVLNIGGATQDSYYDIRISQLMLAMCYGAVNCYALISGYVGVDTKVKYRNIMRLWLQVVFYCIVITWCFQISGIYTIELIDWKHAFTPVISEQYWYFTSYFLMFFFIPYMNKMIDSMTKEELAKLSLLIIFFFSILQTFTYEIFHTGEGYRIWWIMPLYLLGGCMKKLNIEQKATGWLWLGLYLLCSFVTYRNTGKLLSYISPTVLIGSMALVLWFAKLKLGSKLCKVISVLAPLSFGVYIIHVHPLIYHNLISGHFTPLATLRTRYFVIALPLCVLGLYIVCTLIEVVRSFLFKKLGINLLCEKLEKLLLFIEDKVYGKLLVKE